MTRLMNRFVLVAAATAAVAAAIGLTVLPPSGVEARDDREVIQFTGTPTSFGPFDASGFPTVVTYVEADTTRGPVTITSTVGSFFEDIIDGQTRADDPQLAEHVIATEIWDFGNGDQLVLESRNLSVPRLENSGGCEVFQPSDNFGLVTGGTGRFANVSGNVQLTIDPFCISDAFVGPEPITGSIDGLIVVWKANKV